MNSIMPKKGIYGKTLNIPICVKIKIIFSHSVYKGEFNLKASFYSKRAISALVVIILLLGTLLAACSKPAASTQNTSPKAEAKKEPATVAEVATYEGDDRQKLMLEAAKKEGTFNFYTSLAESDTSKFIGDFEKKYPGIKVNLWRAGTDQVLQRVITEAKGGKHTFDLVCISGPEMEALHREKLLQEVKSPHFKDLLPGMLPSHKEWVSVWLSVFVQAYNTNKVKKEELPKTYQDLLSPKWKDRLGIEAKDAEWLMMVVKGMGEEKGIQFFKDLVNTNGISVRKGHSLLNNLVISGEVPLALTVYSYMTEQSKRQGAPMDWFVIEPGISRPNGIAISKKASHPNAAMLFYDYMISDAQKLMAELSYVPITSKVDSPLKNVKLQLVDPIAMLDEKEKWDNLFEDLLVKRKTK